MLEEYHNNPAETQAAFSEGWYKTGDLGFLHEGELFVTGRRKDMMIIGGVNIYPQDIELILNAEPYLIPGRNAVFGVKDERIGTERVVILAETKEEDKDQVDILSITQKIFQALDISVSEVVLLPPKTLKKGTAGKTSRYLNKQLYLQGAYDQYRSLKHRESQSPLLTGIEEVVLRVIPSSREPAIDEHTSLFTAGLIDSFAFAELLFLLEKQYRITITDEFRQVKYFQNLAEIRKTIAALLERRGSLLQEDSHIQEERGASLTRLLASPPRRTEKVPWWEWWVNHFPWRNTKLYCRLLNWAGVQVGEKVTFLGKFHIKLRGRRGSISIGNGAIIGDEVDLRTRENGRMILADNVYLDQRVRIVAAREGEVFIDQGTEIGPNTIINSGGRTYIGKFCMIAGNVNINASTHGIEKNQFIKEQPHSHGEVYISDDVWIGAGASIVMNSKIGEGAVVSSNALVSGEIPPFAICAGTPAKVLRYRE